MQIHDCIQGSPEWLELRAKHLTASEAPAMMGVSKYQTRNDLLKAKATGLSEEVSDDQQRLYDRGHAAEAAARPIAESIIGEELFPATVTVEIDGLPLLASLDGMTMDGAILFEHKLANDDLMNQIAAEELDDHYMIQMDQQMMVTSAEKTLFMASDGTDERCAWMWVSREKARAKAILAGWHQFQDDLANYQHTEAAIAPAGKAPESLPALRIELTGMVTASNLVQYKAAAMSVIDGVSTDLQTDQDFADAEKAVKWAKEVEVKMESAKEHALSQTASIDDLFRALDEIKGYARDKRLNLEKLVKARKEAIRVEILNGGKQSLAEHIAKLEQRISPLRMPAYQADFAGAMKNKRTVASLRDAVDTLLAQAKIDTSTIADDMEINLKALDSLAGEYRHLFHDLHLIAAKPADDFAATVKARIADYKEAEAKRLEAERQKIRQEEEAKAQREAEQKAEAERARIREEERQKAQQDAKTATDIGNAEAEAGRRAQQANTDQRGNTAEATHGKPTATASPQAPAASTSSIANMIIESVMGGLIGELGDWQVMYRISNDALEALLDILDKHATDKAA